MGRAVNVGPILDLDRLLQVGNQPPKLLLDIVFCDRSVAIEDGVERHLVFEITLLEVGRLFLELLQRVQAALLKSELAISNEAAWTVPLVFRLDLDLWVETSAVIAVIARLAGKNKAALLVALAALLTFLLFCQ
jgi:hypothetical protein